MADIQKFTNSGLVSYTRISPNRTSPRNHVIDTITIHCVVGQCTAERLGDIFAPSSRKASSNYGIGYDGKIGMYCEEKDRSWCSSNAANDHRAITIEVASDTTHPYAVTDAAYEALIKLVADICKRNNIKELKWKADKSLIGQVDKQNMTVHRWFANKSCPGDYLYERHGDIANKVNKILGVVTNNVDGVPSTGSVEDEKKIWNYLYSKIGNLYGVAGLMGNLFAESAMRSNNMQDSYQNRLGYNDVTYTAAVDDGSYTNFVKDGVGYGLAQWTYYTRKQALLNYAKSKNKSIGDLTMQLEFLCKELNGGFKSVLNDLKGATSVLEASNSVLFKFEAPADQSEAVQKTRASYGQGYYDKYADKTVTNTPSVESKFKVGDEIKLVAGATYTTGKAIPNWVLNSTLYVRDIRSNGDIVFSTLKSGAITGIVNPKYLTTNTQTTTKPSVPETPATSKFSIGDEVKLVSGAKYTSGKSIASFVFNKKLYVRAVNGDNITISIFKTGDITGIVDAKYLVNYSSSKPATSTSTTSFKVGDTVKLVKGATYYNGVSIASWVFNKTLYVRAVSGDNITISTLKSGAITGIVNKKYLTKC